MESIARAKKFNTNETYAGTGEVKGINFKLIKRKKDICLFERSDGSFEVIGLRQQKASTQVIGGATIEFKEKESYPSGDSWDGKCVKTLERAEALFLVKAT